MQKTLIKSITYEKANKINKITPNPSIALRIQYVARRYPDSKKVRGFRPPPFFFSFNFILELELHTKLYSPT
jgi:hypothetical protein